jgi:hypothetical protein
VPSIVSGRNWRQERLKFLEELRAGDLPEEQRAAVDAEIEELKGRDHWWTRWLHLPHHTDG